MNAAHYSKTALLAALIVSFPLVAHAEATDEAIAKDMAILFRSARAVIARHQDDINNPDLGDKNLTPAVVMTETRENYRAATGHDLVIAAGTRQGQFLQAEVDAIIAVMTEAQEFINLKGKGFKNFLPAAFARQVAREVTENLKGRAEIKLTAPRSSLRHRANSPDEWENNILETKFKAPDCLKDQPFSELATISGKPAFRLILPEYYVEACLSCHGEPKGEKDITGGIKDGGKLGDLGGGISVVLYK